MKIPLNEFEKFIDVKILRRGLSYFNNGAVNDFAEISTGEYEATVYGAEEYTIRLGIKDNVIIEHFCDCPYNLGPVCKHIVAVIFHLQRDELNFANKIRQCILQKIL